MDPPSGCNESQHKKEDRLSALPNEILLNILERLPLHSAFQTTILSRRWRHLPLMLSCLVLNIDEFMECSDCRTVCELMTSFCKATNKLLSSTRECAVKDLRLIFYLADPSYLLWIGQAVSNAIESGTIEFLEFNIWPVIRPTRCSDEHLILYGKRFMLFLDACPNVFRWLTSLTLRRMQFSEADIQTILNTCQKLQTLSLDSCDLNDSGSVLKIDAPNSHLVLLEFVKCYFSQVELICVPRLARLVYDTWVSINPPLRLGHVPLLRNIWLGNILISWQEKIALSGFLSNTRDLSTLYLNFHDEMISHHMCGRNKHVNNADKTNVLCEASFFKHYNLNSLSIKGFGMEEKLIDYIKLTHGLSSSFIDIIIPN